MTGDDDSLSKRQMSRHDEPNEYGFAGETTAPEPPPRGQRDETDEAEAVAVPADDLAADLAAVLPGEQDVDEEAGRRRDDLA